jgi:Alba
VACEASEATTKSSTSNFESPRSSTVTESPFADMSRTKAVARRGPEGRQYRENMKTPDGRRRNKENKKRKHELKKAAKAPQQQSGSSETPPTKQGKRNKKKNGSPEDKDVEESMQLNTANPDAPRISNDFLASSAPTDTSELFKALDELRKTYDVTMTNIISSSHIQQKVTRALGVLAEYPAVPPTKPKVVMLHSKASVASKMITIAEITKRDIAMNGGKWYQYNKLSQVTGERRERKVDAKKKGGDGDVSMADNGDDDTGLESEEEFETMKTPFERAIEGKPKFRAIPVMTLYLSRVRIDSLMKDHT